MVLSQLPAASRLVCVASACFPAFLCCLLTHGLFCLSCFISYPFSVVDCNIHIFPVLLCRATWLRCLLCRCLALCARLPGSMLSSLAHNLRHPLCESLQLPPPQSPRLRNLTSSRGVRVCACCCIVRSLIRTLKSDQVSIGNWKQHAANTACRFSCR